MNPNATGRASLICAAVLALALQAAAQPSIDDILQQAQSAFDGRDSLAKLNQAISLYESLIPQVEDLSVAQQALVLNRLAELYYELGYSRGDEDEANRPLFEKGKAYGVHSLSLNPRFKSKQSGDFEAALEAVTDPAALLWTANNWGTLLGFDGIRGVPQLPNVRGLYERCLEVQETYWGASCHNALGAMLARLPSFLGGNFDQAQMHLERAVELSHDYLTNHVALAEYVGFSHDVLGNINGVRDRDLIGRELNLVLESPDVWPFWDPQAKKDAEALLKTLARFK